MWQTAADHDVSLGIYLGEGCAQWRSSFTCYCYRRLSELLSVSPRHAVDLAG